VLSYVLRDDNNMMYRFLFVVISLVFSNSSFTKEVVEGELTFCHFGPKLKVSDQVMASDKCTGTAKVQGVMWKCVPSDKVETEIVGFQRQLIEVAAQECKRHCERREKGCKGLFIAPSSCGLATDREDAVIMGKRQGCRKDCQGRAFAYCSIYDAGFRTDDPELMIRQTPNCRCGKKTK